MRFAPTLLIGTLLLIGCAPAGKQSSLPHGEHVQHLPGHRDLLIEDSSTDQEIAFVIREGSTTFADYGISHTKEMHLIAVREDLKNFFHLHPERDESGTWRVTFLPPSDGRYWFYADFVDGTETPYTIRFERIYGDNTTPRALARDSQTVRAAGPYRVEFQPSVSGQGVTFAYTITKDGEPVELEEYLGATGHSVLISPSGDFIHTHPSKKGSPVFSTSMPADDYYRIFTQFQIEGQLLTVHFDWENA